MIRVLNDDYDKPWLNARVEDWTCENLDLYNAIIEKPIPYNSKGIRCGTNALLPDTNTPLNTVYQDFHYTLQPLTSYDEDGWVLFPNGNVGSYIELTNIAAGIPGFYKIQFIINGTPSIVDTLTFAIFRNSEPTPIVERQCKFTVSETKVIEVSKRVNVALNDNFRVRLKTDVTIAGHFQLFSMNVTVKRIFT